MDWNFPENWEKLDEGMMPFFISFYDTVKELPLLRLRTDRWAVCAITNEKESTLNFVCELDTIGKGLINALSAMYQFEPDVQVELSLRAEASKISAIAACDTNFPKISCDKTGNVIFCMGDYIKPEVIPYIEIESVVEILQNIFFDTPFGFAAHISDSGVYTFNVSFSEDIPNDVIVAHSRIVEQIKQLVDNKIEFFVHFNLVEKLSRANRHLSSIEETIYRDDCDRNDSI